MTVRGSFPIRWAAEDDPQPDSLDLLDTIKLNLFVSEINVFSPKGDIVTLPQGASVLDFAFAIHSFVGSHCMSAKVNHHLVPLSQRLLPAPS